LPTEFDDRDVVIVEDIDGIVVYSRSDGVGDAVAQ